MIRSSRLLAVLYASLFTLAFVIIGFHGGRLMRPPEPRPDSPQEAVSFRKLMLQDENGVIPPDGLLIAKAQMDAIRTTAPKLAGITNGSWTWLGPGNIGGRVRTIVPVTSSTWFAGGVAGGIWKTTNSGASWAPVNDFLANLAVSTIVVQPGNTSTMYAGTGEGFYNGDAIQGNGIFKSTDGGTTWTQLAATTGSDFYYVNRLSMSPDGTILLAATGTSIFRSTDGGTTFNYVTNIGGNTIVLDVAFNPTDSTKAIASGNSGNAWYSADGGATWTAATGLPGGNFTRVEIAYAPGSPGVVYASVDTNSGSIYKSIDGGVTYTLVSNPQHLGTQGWYDNAVWVDPTNASTLILGGPSLYRSTDGGVTLTQIGGYCSCGSHPDNHAIVSLPGFNGTSNTNVLIGNDGGVFSTSNIYTVGSGNNWVSQNHNFGVTQFYGGAGNATTGLVVGGAQDNGHLRYLPGTNAPNNWVETFGGDGGYAAADPTSANYYYGEYIDLQLHRTTDGGNSSDWINGQYYNGSAYVCKAAPYVITDSCNASKANFIAPFIMDPNNPQTLLAGGSQLWRTNDARTANTSTTGPSWAAIKAADVVGSSSSLISAIAVAPGNSSICWVGHNNGDIFNTTNCTSATPTWNKVSGLPGRYVTRIIVDGANTNRVYVTYGGFTANNLWRTTDGGATWASVPGGGSALLPFAPLHDVAINPTNPSWLYAATEVGVVTSEDMGATWKVPQDGPANVPVDQLFWMGNSLVAVTHGRGMFSVTPAASATAICGDLQTNEVPKPVAVVASAGSPAGILQLPAGGSWKRRVRNGGETWTYSFSVAGTRTPVQANRVRPLTTTLDLVENSAFLASSPGGSSVSQPTIGQTYYLSTNLSINGTASATTFNIRAIADGLTLCNYNYSLNPGTWGLYCGQPWTITPGSHTIRWDINFDNLVQESSYSNNSASFSFTAVQPAATLDVAASSAYLRTASNGGGTVVSSPTLGQTVYFHLDWTVTGTGSDVTVEQRAVLDGTTFCSCGSPGTAGKNYTSSCATAWVVTSGTHTLQWDLDYNHVVNETNTGNDSANASLQAGNPAPTLTSISPTGATAGSAALTLTLTGTNFINSSAVNWGASVRTPTFVSATQLTLPLSTTDLSTAGNVSVTVSNPTPGGGTSGSQTFAITGGPVIATNGVVNSASFTAPIVPGSAVSIFGSSMAASTTNNTSTLPLPTTLGGVTVKMNNIAAPLLYVSASQINAQVPWELAGQTSASVTVTSGTAVSAAATVAVAAAAPAVFATNSAGTGQGLIYNADSSLNGTSNVAHPGDQIRMFAVGLGAVSNQPADGVAGSSATPSVTTTTPTVTIGGVAATVVSSQLNAGATPNVGGLSYVPTYELKVQVPASAPIGTSVPVVVSMGSVNSNSVSMVVGNPAPSISSLSPSTVPVGFSAFTLTVNGTNFASNATVNFGSTPKTPLTGATATQLQVAIASTDVPSTAGTVNVTVSNPTPGGGTSSNSAFTVAGVVSPSSLTFNAVAGSTSPQQQVLTLTGGAWTAQVSTSNGGSWLSMTPTSGTSGTAIVSASQALAAGTYNGQVAVTFGTLAAINVPVTLNVTNPVPSITGLSPTSATAGGQAFVLTVNGAGFANGASTLNWNGSARTTSVASSTQLTAAITAADIASAGTAAVTVVNSTPGGGTSNSAGFAINNSGCSFQLSATSAPFTSSGGAGSVNVTAGTGCNWSALSNSGFVSVTGGATGSGNGTVNYSVAAYNAVPTRSGVITIAGLTFTVTQTGVPAQGTISASAATGGPGGTAQIPISLTLNNGVTADGITFGLQITPNGTAPALTGSLSFSPGSSLPAPSVLDNKAAANAISVSWLNLPTAVSGTIALGQVAVTLPSAATQGQTYTITITGASGSLGGSTNVPLALGADVALTVSSTYTISDVYPSTGSSAGQFGDGVINTLDLIATLRAVTNIAGFLPPTCSDLFDAMDSAPADTSSSRGGDGVLNNLDLIVSLRRVTNVDTARPTRPSRGLACTAAPSDTTAELRRPITDAPDPAGAIELGSPEDLSSGGYRVAIYLNATRELNMTAFSYAVGVPPEKGLDVQARFVANDSYRASLVDEGVKGTIAAAWLDGLYVGQGQRVLLGYVELSGPDASAAAQQLQVFGAVANSRADGSPVRLQFASRN